MIKRIALFAIAFIATTGIAAEQEDNLGPLAEEFSYRRLYDLVTQFRDIPIEKRDRIDFLLRLRPRYLDDEELSPISACILRSNGAVADFQACLAGRDVPGWVRIQVDPLGFISMPLSPTLRAEEAMVVTNQEKDSLQLGLVIVVREPAGRSFNYADVAETIAQINNAIMAKTRIDPERTPQATGLTFKFNPESNARLTVHGETGPQQFNSDSNGSINLPYDESLLEANPRISINSTPTIVFPCFSC